MPLKSNAKLIVAPEEAGERLDKFLTTHSRESRSALQKKIKQGAVTVNGKAAAVHYFLRAGDEVAMVAEKKKEIKKQALKTEMPPIIFENEDAIVLEKPSGLLVHPAVKETGAALSDALRAYYPEIKKVGDNPNRPGIVHRLDRDVSGLLLVAKNQRAFDFFKKQFQERGVYKEYVALVHGILPVDAGRITFKIGRSERRPRMAARPESQEGREAITEYDVVKRFKNATLARVRIETGRTHQIRVHFHALGHPIVGDHVYKIRGVRIRPPLSRPFLHAAKLGFKDLNGEYREFESSLPVELEEYLSKLKVQN